MAQQEKKKTSVFVKVMAVLFAFIVLRAVVAVSDAEPPAPVSPEVAKQQAQDDKARRGSFALKQSMRDPDSYSLKAIYVNGGSGSACYEYSAENAFGATVHERAALVGGSLITRQNKEALADAWQNHCLAKGMRKIY